MLLAPQKYFVAGVETELHDVLYATDVLQTPAGSVFIEGLLEHIQNIGCAIFHEIFLRATDTNFNVCPTKVFLVIYKR